MAVTTETDGENTLGSWISFARCCANELSATTSILVIYKKRTISTKQSVVQLKGFKFNSRPEFGEDTIPGYAEENEFENIESIEILTSEDTLKYGSKDLNDQNDYDEKVSLTSTSLIRKGPPLPDSILGWPLLRRTFPPNQEISGRSRERDISVVEWVMSLPSRSTLIFDEKNMSYLDWIKTKIALNIEMDNSVLNDHEIDGIILLGNQGVEDELTDSSKTSKDETLGLVPENKAEVSSSSEFSLKTKLSESKPGWPLLRISAPVILDSLKESEDMILPYRSTAATPQSETSFVSTSAENSFERKIGLSNDKDDDNPLIPLMKFPNKSEIFSKLLSSNGKLFRYTELKTATSQFSSDMLIGEGGCSNVYKGRLPSGMPVAVKVLKPYKEAWTDFYLEVDIMSSLKHQNITPLIGVCTEDNKLILVYDFLPKGCLEEILHGNGNNSVLPWKLRFKVAVGAAEALNHLHKECLRPVVHRDVKSSNILFSNDFQPQLSDFGLALWGPTDSSYMIHDDVVGTFGYIAPEYFMHGRVSDKVDVYSFGVVLLELLSGRRPIGSQNVKGQQSLVKWAKPILESGDVKALLDPKLDDDFDIVQMQRMVLAANLCINQSARLRPTMSKILEILRGEKDVTEWVKAHDVSEEDDDLPVEFGVKPHSDLSFLATVDPESLNTTNDDPEPLNTTNAISLGSIKRKRRVKLKDYLEEPLD